VEPTKHDPCRIGPAGPASQAILPARMEIQPIVIGTAGHIDHGKSTLVQALTGIDPDRWEEEKSRGMTIDLGFARLELPGGRLVGIVDVPGHERFVRNMVAGATGIDLVVLVVAADDGVMPQTREHLAIMELVGVARGFVALTKVDLVDEELVELAEEDVRETLVGTFLEGAPILRVSAITGQGMDELKAELAHQADAAEPRSTEGVFRMPVQRVFSVRGFGTVLTGIPMAGQVAVGEVLEVLPSGQRGKVRGIQAYHDKVEVARTGHSTALNLTDIDHRQVGRGDVVATPGFFQAQRMVGGKLRTLADLGRPVTNRMQVRVHTGTADALGELVLLDNQELGPGEEGLVQFRLTEPLVCAPGDHFVARLASPVMTLGGGVILEESRYRLKRFKTFVIDELERQARSLGSPIALLEALLARHPDRWVPAEELAVGLKRERKETTALLESLATQGRVSSPGPGERWIHADALALSIEQTRDALDGWFQANPNRRKIDVRELRNTTRFDPAFLGTLLGEMEAAGELVQEPGGLIVPSGREVELDEATAALRLRVIEVLERLGLQPPVGDELRAAVDADGTKLRSVLELLVDEGLAVHVGGELYLAAGPYGQVRDAIVANCERNGQLAIPELRDGLGTTRKFLIPLLEHFDTVGLTARRGGQRVLKRR
jgi:selenocysteine-specific elongation factor